MIVPDYFHGDKRPLLVSPEGASLDGKVIDALTGYTHYAQAGANAAGKVAGHVVTMTGSASIVRNGVSIEVNNGDVVYQSDVVQTGSGSTLGLVLIDGTTFNLSANARFMLNDLTYDATSNPNGSLLNLVSSSNHALFTLVQGGASFVAGQVAKTGDMEVGTPVAIVGIRGTAVILEINSVDGDVSISVADQHDGQVHAVQVFKCLPTGIQGVCTAGEPIGRVTSEGATLKLTPVGNFQVTAQEIDKTTAQVAQEFTTFQQVLTTYDIGKQLAPNTPPPSDGKRGDANPQTLQKYAGSPPPSPSAPSTTLFSEVTGQSSGGSITPVAVATLTIDTGNSAVISTTKSLSSSLDTTQVFVLPSPAPMTISSIGGPVNQASQTVSGTVDVAYVGTTVTLLDTYDGVTTQLGTVTVGSGGVWSKTVNLSGDGTHIIVAQDTAANITTSTPVVFTLDTTAPTVAITSAGGPTNQASQTITGTVDVADAGATVTILDGATSVGTAVVQSNGSWSTSVTLANGTNSLTAQVSDTAGNSATSAAVVYTLSTTGPTVTEVLAFDTGSSASDHITSNDALSGTGLANTLVHFTIDGVPSSATATANAQGVWTFTPSGLSDGAHTIVASQTDGFGNTGTASLSFTLDTTAPAVAITTIEGGDTLINATEAAGGIQISGTAEIGSSLTVNGSAVTVDGTGHWTTSVTPAGQGALTVTAVATDAAGNSASTSTTLTVDTIAPAVAITSTGGPVNQAAQTISGTGEAGTTITLFDNGAQLQLPTVTVGQNGLWSATVTLANGSNSLTAGDTDAAGNAGSSSAVIYTLSSVGPTVTESLTIDSGTSSSDRITSSDALSGTGLANTVVQFTIDGSPIATTVTADAQGIWSFTPTGLADGAHTIVASQTDGFGNTGTASLSFTLDTTAPAVAITTIEGGDTLINAAEAAGGIQISGTAEIGSSLTVNGSAVTVDGTGHWTTSVTPAGQGALTVTAVATDAAGNSATTSTTLTVDTIAPAVAITTIEGGDTLINAAEAAGGIQISGTAEIGSSLTVNGSAVTVDGTGHWTTSVTPAGQGALTVTAVATDAAGNSATTSTTLTVDTIAPAVAITTIEGGDTLINAAEAAGGIQISGTAEIGSSLTVNGSAVTVDGTGHWTTSVTPAGQGALTVTAVATDAAGNSASTSTTLTVDTIAPAVAITSTGGPVNQAAQTISGTGEAGTTITLFDNGAQLQLPTVTVGQNGLWSASVTLANGSNSLTAGDTDAAGNAGSSSAVIYTLSSVGPTVTESLTIDSGTSSSDRITSSDALSGTGLANTVVQFTIDGSPIATTVTADAQGIWSFTPTGLADGAHTIVASQTDGFGNTGTASLSFTLDTTAPAVAITTIEGGDTLINAAEAAGGIQISGTAEIGSSLTVNGSAVTVDGTGHWTTSVTPAGQGALTVTAVATDAAGNSATTSTTLTVDTIAPAVAITTIEGGDTLINATEAAGGIQISGTAEIGSSLTVNGSAVTVDGTGHWTTSVTPAGRAR